MKIYDVTFTYTTTVVAQNEEEAEILAQNDVVTDCLECVDIQEKENTTGIIATWDEDEHVPEGKHKVYCECCNNYLIYDESNEEHLHKKDCVNEDYNFISCPVCEDMVETNGYNSILKKYYDNRIE